TADYTVSNNNLRETMEQWTNVHGTDASADETNSSFDGNSQITRKVYKKSGVPVVTTYDINGMGHAVAIDPGTGAKQGGSTGSYATDVNFLAAYWAASGWGLTGSTPPPPPSGVNAPGNLSAVAQSSASIALSWTDNSTNETAFLVERSLSSGSGYSQIASLSSNTTSYTDNNLQASTTYYYRVRAQAGTSYSAYSAVASETTPATGGGGSGGGGGETIVIEQPLAQGYLSYVSTSNSAQSFTLSQSARLNTIAVKFRTSISNSTLKIFNGNTVTGTPVYTQTGISKGSGWQTVTVSNPPLLAAGQHTFQITNSVFSYTYTDTYSGGNIYLDTYGYTVFDAAFKLTLTASGTGSRLAGPEANAAQNSMQYVSSFGYNPGNLGMYLYRPSNMPANAPVVVAMHGCSQSASGYAANTGWNEMADKYKFYVIYPQQSGYNNGAKCFNWFNYYDYTRGYGENRSVKSMVDYVKSNYSVNSSRVYATGFSAGGGMTTLMLATWPEVFNKGAVLAGVPYHAAANAYAAGYAMNPGYNLSPSGWGNLVRGASNYSGSWPEVAVFHGTSDYTVNDNNVQEIVDQWTNVHSTDRYADRTTYSYAGNSRVTQRKYRNGSGKDVVVTYSISSMGHDVPVDPGTGTRQGGSTGTFAVDVNFHSTYWAATFFGLTGSSYREEMPDETATDFSWKPVSGGVEMLYGEEQKELTVNMYSLSGQQVYQATHKNVQTVQVVPQVLKGGIYLIKSISNGEVRTLKVMIE
ncbi:MAG: PHB depolymerase family esterase, partial [Cyclobacteriaceae bacterium]